MRNPHRARTHVILFFSILLFVLLGFRLFEWTSVYHPIRDLQADPGVAGLPFDDVEFVTEDDKTLHGWWVPAENPRAVLLFCHGNGGNISGRIFIIQSFHRMGYSVFAFDYRGYGRSRGWPSEQGTYRDARAAYEVVRSRMGDDPSLPIIVYGRSLGGAVAAQLALDKPVQGLVLESTFTSVPDMGRRLYPFLPVRLVSSIRYDTRSKIPKLDCPVLIAHSEGDTLIPLSMSRELYELAPEPKTFFELRGEHNDHPFDSSPRYTETFIEFTESCGRNVSRGNLSR